MLIYLTQGLLLGGAAAAQPGPFQAYLLSQTLRHGWRRTIWAAFAPLLSDGPIVALVLLVLTQTPDWLLHVLQIGGGLFLLTLAWSAYRAVQTAVPNQLPPETAVRRSLLQAAMMNALSPNPYIFWATIAGPILIEGWRQSPSWGASFVFGFYGTLIGGFAAFVIFFALTRRIDPRLNEWLAYFSAAALFLFGLYQLAQGIGSLDGAG